MNNVKDMSWIELNSVLKDADEAAAKALLASEKKGKRRLQYMLRIHSRLNAVRAHTEREEIRKLVK